MKRRPRAEPPRTGRSRRAELRATSGRRAAHGGGDLRSRAEAILRKGPGELARMPVNDLQTLVQELQVHQIELEIQNEELRRAQLELAQSRDRYTDLYEFAPVGYLTVDQRGKIREANLSAATLLRMERRRLVGRVFSSFVLPEAQNTWRRHFADVYSGPVKQTCELALRRADGVPAWVRLETIAMAPEQQSPGRGAPECRVILVDVTERKRVERSLAESEKRLRLALAAGNIGEWVLNLRTDEVDLSSRWKAQLGYDQHAIPNHLQEWTTRLHPDDRQRMLELVGAYRKKPWQNYEAEYRLRHADGSYRWFLARADFTTDERRAPMQMLGWQIDITARKRAEEALHTLNETLEQRVAERTAKLHASNERLAAEIAQRRKVEGALRESGERLHAVVDTAADGIVTIDARGTIESVNRAAERLFGYNKRELVGRNVSMLMPSPHREGHDRYLARYMETKEKHIIGIGREVTGRRKDGSVFPMDLTVSEFHDSGLMFTGIMRDVTERKRLQRAVADSVVEEQQAIGHELHDGVAQQLSGVDMMISVLEDQLRRRAAPEAAALSAAAAQLRLAQEQLRRVIRGLYRYTVPADGLEAALRELLKSTEELHGLRCTLTCSGRIHIPDANVATQLYCIAREAVNNAIRHASAKRITIRLEADEDGLLLTIRDDGRGIEPASVRSGMGTQIMAYRAELIGAMLDIRPARRGGTLVACPVPLQPSPR